MLSLKKEFIGVKKIQFVIRHLKVFKIQFIVAFKSLFVSVSNY